MSNHNIRFEGGKVEWDTLSHIDWSKTVDYRTQGYLSQDILQLVYSHCLIDLGWYGAEKGHFTIMVIMPGEYTGEYDAESWQEPIVRIPCKDQYDMLVQLQRAIDVYPALTTQWRT